MRAVSAPSSIDASIVKLAQTGSMYVGSARLAGHVHIIISRLLLAPPGATVLEGWVGE